MGMTLTKEFVNSCRKVGVLRDFLCQAIDQVDEKDKEIAELKEERRWRKCSDEMPDEDEEVLFSDGNYIYLGCWTTWDGGCSDYSYETFSGWVESGSEKDYDFNEIKYWQPLPSAPKEGKK